MRHRRRGIALTAALSAATVALLAGVLAPSADAAPAPRTNPVSQQPPASQVCAPRAVALGFSDALDKLDYHGAVLGGLSSLAYDQRSHGWVSAVDNHGADPARIWFFRNLSDPGVTRSPLVLKKPDGTTYDGTNSDNEGLAVLPNGNFVVSSETEPSIRVYGRDGVEKASLPVPARFAVAGTSPAGQATSNATLEGLTISPSGREIVAAMEGALSGDVSSTGDATLHRFLVYDVNGHGVWTLRKQIGYRADPGMRIPEVAAYDDNSLLVEEAAFSATAGNSVNLFAVTNLNRGHDVSNVDNLSSLAGRDIVGKSLVADLVDCPMLGAQSKEIQTNPLLDNFEGMAVTARDRRGLHGVSLISDDNFSATQTTRVLNLVARLP